ncbi:hypothetical protein ACA910_007868 [Epithemia clementina (nom. ined.)]
MKHVQEQIDWVRSKGGFVSSKMEIRPIHPSDVTSPLGAFATDDFQEGDLILSIPRDCLMTSEMEDPDWICSTTRNLVREMKLGENSYYAPYIKFLNAQPFGQLPSMWSSFGKDLLLKITGGAINDDDQLLPPLGPVGWLDDEWRTECDGGDDLLEQHAFLTVIQRGWDDILIPIYDLLNHRNGKWHNTVSNSVRGSNDDDVQVYASKLIRAGDEIYGSYTDCTDCGGRAEFYGTPEILRDYGFVEPYPQKFVFGEQGIAFTIDKANDDDDELELTWLSDDDLDDETIAFFEHQLERVSDVYARYMKFRNEEVPPHELQILREFAVSYIAAMERMLEVAKGTSCAVVGSTYGDGDVSDDSSRTAGTCTISSSRYSNLDRFFDDYDETSCDKDVSLDFTAYETVDVVQSRYQLSTYIQNPYNKNTCFDLDDIYQICGSYRPHYHEMVVHYTARFLPKVERVLWVGGGDSMLLHEILKYPELEFVIGLELDQTVTRWAFKHFGSQPHWDNDKVQWWYGDGAKSLLMLPKGYFGTFDMVLVDLSETVMSGLVTKDLDIMSALSLLLKPDGILVKNELYFEKLNPIFKHTIQVHYSDVPVICSQCLCLGSNGVDFTYRQLTDHKVETMFAPLNKVDQNFEYVHDYLKNPDAQRHCITDEEQDDPVEQESSPGILMVVEAENATGELEPSSKLESLLLPALTKQGLSVVSTVTSDDNVGAVVVVVVQEGYVVARTWPEHMYCAFDIHLWSSFQKHDSIKKSLVAAIGADYRFASSFRIVGGGMFGVRTWKEDFKRRGPKFTQDCSEPSLPKLVAPFDRNVVDDIVREIMGMTKWANVVGAVICGPKDQECHNLDMVPKQPAVRKTIPIHACDSIKGNIEYEENSSNLKYACENELVDYLNKTIGEDKISIVVVDQSTTFAMAQVVNKIVKRNKYKKIFFTDDIQVIAPLIDATETWRKYLVDDFRAIIPEEPAFMADVLFNNTESSLEVAVFLSGDGRFVSHMKDLQKDIERRTGLSGDIRGFGGGKFKFQQNFKASQWFLPGDYDQRGPYEQWHSQQPTGHQSKIQMESEEASFLSKELVKDWLVRTLAALNIETSQPVREFTDIGDGSVLVAVFSDGRGQVVTLYDGRKHVSLNIFTYHESTAFAMTFADQFNEINKSLLDVVLFDEMPRGYGRVVNFWNDIKPRREPSWALDLIKANKGGRQL